MPPTPTAITTTTHLCKSLSLLLLIRPRTLITVPQATHLKDPQWVLSFCSKTLKFSAKFCFLSQGKQVHSLLLKLGLCHILSLQNQILSVYVKCKEFGDVNKLFDEMRVRNVVTWNTVICGVVYCANDKCEPNLCMGFYYFRRMLLDKVLLDAITMNAMLRACVELNDVEIGKQLHCFVVKMGFELDTFVNSALVELYGKCGLVEVARRVFDNILCKDVVFWNVMMCCYALNGLGEEAFSAFNLMRLEKMMGDDFTFSSLLNSCGTLGSSELGMQIHCLVIKLSFDLDVFVASGLVDTYAKSKNIDDAHKLFDGMAVKSAVSWNTMVVAYGQNGDGNEAANLLKEMLLEDYLPDELTFSSVLSSCGRVSASCEIMQVHAYVVKNGFQGFLSIANALLNAYSKCGSMASALRCFRMVQKPDLVTWTSLIDAYAFHGLPEDSVGTFEKMLSNGVKPDGIAFLGVISACDHAGLITEGLYYFSLMTKYYHIVPDLEHYTCLVDLLGRAGLLDEAFSILMSMPIEQRSDAWGSFFGACKIHGDVKLAQWAAEKLFELEPNEPVTYTLMSNMYASEGHWSDVARARKLMRGMCDHKIPACSWMEISGKVHTFLSSDKCHPQALNVYNTLGTLLGLMKEEHIVSLHNAALDE